MRARVKNLCQSNTGAAFYLAVVLVAGIVLRVWYLAQVADAPDFEALRQDLDVQDYHARGIITGDWQVRWDVVDPQIRTTPYYRPPGYVYFLTALYFVTHGSYWAPRVVNAILGLSSVLLMYYFGRRHYGELAGRLTAFFMATYWGFLYYEGEVNDPALFVFLVACLFLILAHWADTRRVWAALLAGLIIGIYAIMRPNILLFGPVAAAWMLWVGWRRGERRRRILVCWLCLGAAAFAVILPVTIRNYVVSGEFVPISTYFGENLLIGNAEDSDGVTPWTPYLQQLEGTGNFSVWHYDNIVKGLGKEVGKPDLSHSEASSIFARKAVAFVREHKLRTCGLALKKAALFWSPKEITENKVVQGEKDFYPPLKYLPGFAMVSAVFWAGLWFVLRDSWKGRLSRTAGNSANTAEMTALMLAFILVYWASFLPFFVNARARVPLYGLFFLIGAYGLQTVWSYVKSRGWTALATSAVAYSALWAVFSVEIVPYEPDMHRWHYDRADSYYRSGRLEKAQREAEAMLAQPGDPSPYMPFRLGHQFARAGWHEAAYKLLTAALDIRPEDQHPAYREDLTYHVACQLAALDRTPEAIDAFNAALAINPRDARAHNDLALQLERAGRDEEAKAHYELAIEYVPDFALAHSNFAAFCERMGEREKARMHFELAARHAPDSGDFAYNLARVFAEAGDANAAEEQYRRAISLSPRDPRPRNNLGLLLEARGAFAEAAALYEEAVRLDRGFSLARANLAALLARAGHLDEAEKLCREALLETPDEPVTLNALGFVLGTKQDFDGAIDQYRRSIQSNPDYTLAHRNLGIALRMRGERELGLASLRKAAELAPLDCANLLSLGDALREDGNLVEAEACYRKATEISACRESALSRLGVTLPGWGDQR